MKRAWTRPHMNELAVGMTEAQTKTFGANDGTLIVGIPGIPGCITVGFASGCNCAL